MTRRFVSLQSAPIPMGENGELPTELVVFPWGERQTRFGRIALGARSAAQVPLNQAARKFDTVALDFAHNTVEGSAAYKGEPAKIAANCTLSVVPGRGVVFTPLNWTPEGREHVLGGHYKVLSIAAELDDHGDIIFVHSAALCRQGEVVDCTLFSAVMDTSLNKPKTPEELSAFLCEALGLPPDTAPDQVVRAILAKLNLKPEPATEVELSAAIKAELTALAATFKTEADDLRKQLASLTGANESATREAILSAAASEGKVVPKTAAEKMAVADLRALCAELPVTVPLERRQSVTVALNSPGATGAVYDAEMGARLGISKETFDKHAASHV